MSPQMLDTNAGSLEFTRFIGRILIGFSDTQAKHRPRKHILYSNERIVYQFSEHEIIEI